MFQICKPYPLHYPHIHLGICLLIQNYPKVQLPSLLSVTIILLYSEEGLQQTEKNLRGESISFASPSLLVL